MATILCLFLIGNTTTNVPEATKVKRKKRSHSGFFVSNRHDDSDDVDEAEAGISVKVNRWTLSMIRRFVIGSFVCCVP